MNPFDTSFEKQYELAKKIGDQRFGSECKHEHIYAGRCCNCLRRVYPRLRYDPKYRTLQERNLHAGEPVKYSVSYYTLSDGKNTVEVEANNADEAAFIARELDDTFDRLMGVAVLPYAK